MVTMRCRDGLVVMMVAGLACCGSPRRSPTAPPLPGAAPVAAAAAPRNEPGPFQFREAALLELRAPPNGEWIDPVAVEHSCIEAPSPANPRLPNPADPDLYRGGYWITLLAMTDRCRRSGGFRVAEALYLHMLDQLRAAQGPASDAVAAMLDHLAELYLEIRDPERAYQYLTDALAVRRKTIAAEPPGEPVLGRHLHLADMLTRLGQIDLARGSLARAETELSEANAITGASSASRGFVGALYATYFLSRALEQQGKAREAEQLWLAAVAARASDKRSAAWVNALKEQAAFYARRGELHHAAEIVRVVQQHRAGVRTFEDPLPGNFSELDARPRDDNPGQPGHSSYDAESDAAMAEILALDRWQTDGAESAAALIERPIDLHLRLYWLLDRLTDTERAQLLRWYERRVFLDLSILLDGPPSSSRVEQAYAILGEIKGLYLEHRRSQVTEETEGSRLFNELTDVRALLGRQFIAAAVDGKPFDPRDFLAAENLEQLLMQGIATHRGPRNSLSLPSSSDVPDHTALVDIVVWDRLDRSGRSPQQREYGAFVLRKDRPAQYIRLGAAGDLDGEIASLTPCPSATERGAPDEVEHALCSADPTQQLRRVYQQLFAPLEPALAGVDKLLVVPDGELAMVPFGALLDPASHAVLERYTVAYLNTARDLLRERDQSESAAPVIVGDPDFDAALSAPASTSTTARMRFPPLSGARTEASDVARLLGVPRDRVLVGGKARQGLLGSIVGPEILHLATHSKPYLQWTAPATAYSLFEFPRPLAVQDPFLQSVIALAGANHLQEGAERGLLTGLEVASLHLHGTRLAVLSSCESAQGVPIDGQGVMGLRAAFSIAGAESVVMSLWPVADQAGRELMHRFYSHLAAGPVEALRAAQREMRAEPAFADPRYWAGYVVSTTPDAEPPRARSGASTAATNAAPANAAPAEGLAPPVCWQMSTRTYEESCKVYCFAWDWIRVSWAGAVKKLASSPERAVYELNAPGDDLAYRHSALKPDGSLYAVGETDHTRDRNCKMDARFPCTVPIIVTVEKTPDHGSVLIQGGTNPVWFSILLKGRPEVIPSLDLPERLAPLSAYTEAVAWPGENRRDPDAATITQLGLCKDPEP